MSKQFIISDYLGRYCGHAAINRSIQAKVDMDGESMHTELLRAYLSDKYDERTAEQIINLEREQIRMLSKGISSRMSEFREKVNKLVNQQKQ